MAPFVALTGYQEFDAGTMSHRAASFYDEVKRRRSVREFSDRAVLVVGYPAENATVPDITRKPLDAIATFI